MIVKIDDLRGPEIARLLSAHLEHMSELSPPGSFHALDLDSLRQPQITFWSVWEGTEIMGCGALKELDRLHGEVKSMRTVPSYLRKGVGWKLLETITTEARRRGYRRLSVETGACSAFAAAHGLYEKFGFCECSSFGDYKQDPNSRFFMMEL